MTKKNLLILLGLTISLITNAQQIMTTAGNNMSNNSVLANWTIGEIITEPASNTNSIVTTGINQPVLKVKTSILKIVDKIVISIFPNPTSQILAIKYEGLLPITVKILSLNRTALSIVQLTENYTQLDFSKYANGIYVIVITDNFGSSNTYKIVKQ